jgi:hypothetical protein
MDKRTIIIGYSFLAAAILSCCIFGGIQFWNGLLYECNFLNECKEYTTTIADKAYSFNAATILDNIDNDVVNNLFLRRHQFDNDFVLQVETWTEQDFFNVTGAFFKEEMGENLDDWEIHAISYETQCNQPDDEFGSTFTQYVKYVEDGKRMNRLLVSINIDPSKGKLEFSESIYEPAYFIWDSYQIGEYEINAVEALHIADKYSGNEFREDTNHECEIKIHLKEDSALDYWFVKYGGEINGEYQNITINVDENSGEVIENK